jgi:hypothetical protein
VWHTNSSKRQPQQKQPPLKQPQKHVLEENSRIEEIVLNAVDTEIAAVTEVEIVAATEAVEIETVDLHVETLEIAAPKVAATEAEIAVETEITEAVVAADTVAAVVAVATKAAAVEATEVVAAAAIAVAVAAEGIAVEIGINAVAMTTEAAAEDLHVAETTKQTRPNNLGKANRKTNGSKESRI